MIEQMPLYIHMIFSFLAAAGFAFFQNAPRKTIFIAAGVGMVCWIVYILLMRMHADVMFSNFIAAAMASFMSENLSIKLKKPTILFVIPGIINLIPGLGLYNTMFYMLEGKFDQSLATGAKVIFASGSISLGVIVASSLFRTYHSWKYNKYKNDACQK